MISAPRGNITIDGQVISLRSLPDPGFAGGVQTGILTSTTAVNANGSIFVNGRRTAYSRDLSRRGLPILETLSDPGAIDLEAGSVVAMLPDILPPAEQQRSGDAMLAVQPTLPSDPVSAAQFRRPVARLQFRDPAVIELGAFPAGPDPYGKITLGEQALIVAPSASVSLSNSRLATDPETGLLSGTDQPPNILMRAGAEIDVSGIMDVVLPMSSNAVRIARVGNADLADTPLQRNGFLFGREIIVDRRLSGTRADGSRWVGSPLLNAQGYVDSFGRTVSELLTPGGSIAFKGVSRVESGAALNIAGGYVRYLGGSVPTSWLRSADGKSVVDISRADPNTTYASFADEFIVRNKRFGTITVYPTFYASRRAAFESSYIDGSDAGALSFEGAAVINGTLSAGVVSGSLQRAGSGRTASRPARGGVLDLGGLTGRSQFTLYTPAGGRGLSPSSYAAQFWSTRTIEDAGFADVVLGAAGSRIRVEDDAVLTLPDGGAITLRGDRIDIGGRIIAHAGSITLALSAFDPSDTN
ncbi:MAG TPA: hypothetical protein VES39_04465, partial [Rhodospirillales bacterium]|nr:hypothetical protein [Rhodospirillales bacterium]